MFTSASLRLYRKFFILIVLLGGVFVAASVANKVSAGHCCSICHADWVVCMESCQNPIHEKWIACTQENCDPAYAFCLSICNPLC